MKILVLAASYPSEAKIYESAFIRPRVVAYHQAGHQVSVLNFKATEAYCLDGVQVLSPGDLQRQDWDWDLCVFHAPNLRNHLAFIVRNWSRLPAVCFTFHGHEVMYLNLSYPEPFAWNRGRFYRIQRFAQHCYDAFKLLLLRGTLEVLSWRNQGLLLLFVSEDFRRTATRNLALGDGKWASKSAVVWNPLAEEFLRMRHHCHKPLADFLTIRPVDGSKHCIDLVVECARQNPGHSFHVYGEGSYFHHHQAPPNLTHFPHFVANKQIAELLTKYRGALMPSRCDSHGVMMCELAVTGMPLLASDIAVHLEALGGFPNVSFLNNESPLFDAADFLQRCTLSSGATIPSRFELENTAGRELELFRRLVGE